MKNKALIIFILVLLGSCNSDKERTLELLTDYTKKRVRNPNSVIVHNYQIFDDPVIIHDTFLDQNLIFYKKSKFDYITHNGGYINYLFSARNNDGNEIYRKVEVYIDSNKRLKDISFPENIDVENGYLTGTCNYYIGNLVTNKSFENYCDKGKILILNIDTLSGQRKYRTSVENGLYNLNGVIPGNYFFKEINYEINLEQIFNYYGNCKNYFLLLNIKEIMDFYDIYASKLYGYSNEAYFKNRLKYLEHIQNLPFSNISEIPDRAVELSWRDFTKSINREFLDDFEVNDDYKYLNEYDKIHIDPSSTTKHSININKIFY